MGDAGLIRATGDQDSLDQELVLALGIICRIFLHGLKEYYNEALVFVSLDEVGCQQTLNFNSLARVDATGVRSDTVTGTLSAS